jgi:N-acetylneuraminic acid mutarotase
MVVTTRLEATTEGPSPRRAAGGVLNRDVFAIGGAGRMEGNRFPHFSQVWRFDADDRTWHLSSENEIPAVRVPGCTRLGDAFYIVGGRNKWTTFHNDVYRIGPDSVERVATKGPRPSPRYAFPTVGRDDRLYAFGGLRVESVNELYTLFGDLWTLDFTTGRWTKLSEDGPYPRYGSAMGIWDDELVVFGGRYRTPEDGWRYTDETWRFDLSSETWHQERPDRSPAPRYGSGTTVVGDRLLLYGGMSKSYVVDALPVRRLDRIVRDLPVRTDCLPTLSTRRFHDDLWVYDRNRATWTRVAGDTGVPPLKTPIVDTYENRLVVGMGNHDDVYYDGFWTLEPLDEMVG